MSPQPSIAWLWWYSRGTRKYDEIRSFYLLLPRLRGGRKIDRVDHPLIPHVIVVEKAQVTVFNRLRMLLLEVGWSPARDSVDSKSLDCESPLSVALRMPPLFLVAVQRLGLRYRAGDFMDALFLRTRTTYKWTTWMQVQTCCMNYLGDMLVSPYIHTCSHQTPHKQHNTQGRTKIKR